jgi:hypothetical protein
VVLKGSTTILLVKALKSFLKRLAGFLPSKSKQITISLLSIERNFKPNMIYHLLFYNICFFHESYWKLTENSKLLRSTLVFSIKNDRISGRFKSCTKRYRETESKIWRLILSLRNHFKLMRLCHLLVYVVEFF